MSVIVHRLETKWSRDGSSLSLVSRTTNSRPAAENHRTALELLPPKSGFQRADQIEEFILDLVRPIDGLGDRFSQQGTELLL